MSMNTLEYANQLLAENERLKQKVVALESDANLSTKTLKNADAVVLAAKAKFDQICADNAALQEQVRALAAENAALTSGFSFFMHSDDAGFDTFKTRDAAVKAAEDMLDDYRGDSGDGWPEETESTCWGVIVQRATECDYKKPAQDNGWQGYCDYKLLPETPATDAAIREIRAQAVDAFGIYHNFSDKQSIQGEAKKYAARIRAGEV